MILIGADFVPTTSNTALFAGGNAEELFGSELNALLNSADYRIFNLETPLCDKPSPISKCGKNFMAPTACVNGYAAAHADLLTLANNHILDQGEAGLAATCGALQQKGIAYVGVGDTPAKAAIPKIFMIKDKRVGVLACAEHEFSIVGEHTAGANPFDPLETPDQVAALRAGCDYVIVLYHGGKEYYRYPSPQLQKTCRKRVQKGADLVVCQHSHCIGCEEQFQGGTIVYGQGNFLFDNSNNEMWQTALLIGVDDSFHVTYYPLSKNGNTVRLAQGEAGERILGDFFDRSEQIRQDGFVQKQFAAFAREQTETYLMAFGGRRSVFFYALNKLFGYRLNKRVLRRYGKEERQKLRNCLECEAIREVIIGGCTENGDVT